MEGFDFKPESPCVGVCVLDDETQLCRGCLRTIPEISAWWAMSKRDRGDVLLQIAARRKRLQELQPGRQQA